MQVMSLFLIIVLALILGIGGWMIVKQYEDKKRESEARAAAMLATLQEHAATVARSAPGAAPAIRRKDALLEKSQNVLYLLLKTALPDHVIFVNLRLADLVEVTPATNNAEREQRLRMLERQRIEFAVCNRMLHVLAAISLDAADGDAQRIGECLQSAGIRYVRLAGDKLPKRDEIRAQIVG